MNTTPRNSEQTPVPAFWWLEPVWGKAGCDEDLYCLWCGYNLRRLHGDPIRCPECGVDNALADVRIPASLIACQLRRLEAYPRWCVAGLWVMLLGLLPAVLLGVWHTWWEVAWGCIGCLVWLAGLTGLAEPTLRTRAWAGVLARFHVAGLLWGAAVLAYVGAALAFTWGAALFAALAVAILAVGGAVAFRPLLGRPLSTFVPWEPFAWARRGLSAFGRTAAVKYAQEELESRRSWEQRLREMHTGGLPLADERLARAAIESQDTSDGQA